METEKRTLEQATEKACPECGYPVECALEPKGRDSYEIYFDCPNCGFTWQETFVEV